MYKGYNRIYKKLSFEQRDPFKAHLEAVISTISVDPGFIGVPCDKR